LLGTKVGGFPWGTGVGATAGTMYSYPESRPSANSPVVGPLIDTFLDSFNIFEKSRNVAKNFQNIYGALTGGVIDNQITVETSPTVNVKVGDRQLDAIIEEKVQREHARHRQGYGDTALAEPGR